MPKADPSIRLRLLLSGAVAIALAMTLAWWGLTRLFEHHVERRSVARLETDVRELMAGLTIAEDGSVTIARRPLDQRYAQPFSGSYWQVEAGDVVAERSRSLWDERLPLPKDDPGAGRHEHVVIGPGGKQLIAVERQLVVARPEREVRLRITAALDRAETILSVRSFGREIAVMLVAFGALLLAAFAAAVMLGLAPLARLRNDLRSLQTGEAKRLHGRYPAEVAHLVDDLNHLLRYRERAAEQARRRAADLAHGLKTPITAISVIADDMKNNGDAVLAQELAAYATTMHRHVERELTLARNVHAQDMAAPVALRPLADGLVRSLKRLPCGADLVWQVSIAESLTLRADATALAEVMGNLLDNARKWATCEVSIRASASRDHVVISVADDGPGVSEHQLAALTDRGKRLDQSKPGSGLGLSITREIVEALGGRLDLANATDGGFVATVAIPSHQAVQ